MKMRDMQPSKASFDRFHWARFFTLSAVAIVGAGCFAAGSMAQQPGQKTFSSPQEASSALVKAEENNDEKTLLEILGPDAKDIVSSGDDAEDAQNRANFVKRYEQMHRLIMEPDGTTTLYVGAENWPLPIPLMHKGNAWYFDTAAGKMEILYRRVGRNEISTIHVCQQLVAAEKEYYATHHNEYAQRIFSDEGQHDGLYWKAADGQSQSPVGPLVAAAGSEGRNGASSVPYRGYFYQILTRQGTNAPGGAKGYIVNQKMTLGFAFVAYPAKYRASGVMTFIVGEDGTVYRKDLGSNTLALARAMKEYDPDSSWSKEEDQQQAGDQTKTN